MPVIPIINMDVAEVMKGINDRLEEPKTQRRVILVVVCIALLLDNMLYMVIVPIIPPYLREIGSWHTHRESGGEVEVAPLATPYLRPPFLNETLLSNASFSNATTTPDPAIPRRVLGRLIYEGEDSAIGLLFASKAMVQLMVNPFSGAIIDRIGYDIPMVIGLTIMFFSTAVFACGRSYTLLFMARSLQGVGSAFADTAGLAMIADRFTEENERSKALGIALAFISFGCLVAPPFGGFLYDVAGKEVPFIILSLVSLADGIMVLFVMQPLKTQMKNQGVERLKGTPLWRLLIDPQIAVCAGALVMANVSLAFLEPTISKWMLDNMHVTDTQVGMIWLPAFFPHVAGVYLTVRLARDHPKYQWLLAAIGLTLEGLCCFIIPFAKSFWVLMFPICVICFGIALIDTALLPTLGYLVDVHYVSVYGSIYAIADISYSLAYAFGPIIAGGLVESIGFTALNVIIAVSNLAYVPVLILLRHVYDYKPFENEANVLMGDPPAAQYQTYMMQDQKASEVGGNVPNEGDTAFNHLEYGKGQTTYKETRFADPPPEAPQSIDGHVPGNPFVHHDVTVTNGGHTVQHRQVSSRGRSGFRGRDTERILSSEDEME